MSNNKENTEKTFLSDFPQYENPEVSDLKERVNELYSKAIDMIDMLSMQNSFLLAILDYAMHSSEDRDFDKNMSNLKSLYYRINRLI